MATQTIQTFTLRTEDLSLEDIEKYFVETKLDRENIEFLKSNNIGLLIGSRGTEKSFLLRKAEKELLDDFESSRLLPVFVSFSTSALVDESGDNFKKWMLSKVLFAIQGQLQKIGIIKSNIFAMLMGEESNESNELASKIKDLIKYLEDSWKKDTKIESGKLTSFVTDFDYFKRLIEEICTKSNIKRIVLLFDEACHNFIPKQQQEFFTMFRNIRTPFICSKAAVYPGVSSYGTFEVFHDAVVKRVEKNILADDYIEKMREIIKKQINEETYNNLARQGELLNALIWASTGNPRILLKSVYEASNQLHSLNKSNTNTKLKDFYRTQMWNEYTKLGDKFPKYKDIIEWGREFVENFLIPEIYKKNERSKNEDDYTKHSVFFIIHKDSPEIVKKALGILEYSGILTLKDEGYKMHNGIYNRYQLNIGIAALGASESDLTSYISRITTNLSIKVLTEYGKESKAFEKANEIAKNINLDITGIDIETLLKKDIEILDISQFQKDNIRKVGFNTLSDILMSEESELKKAYLIGDTRARRIHNQAMNALLEYIMG